MASSDQLFDPRQEGSGWRRAGFWRRVGALLVDSFVVLIPLQIVVAMLFAQTNGAIQGSFGFNTTYCTALEKLPEGVQSSLDGFTSIADCTNSLLGFVTSRALIVTKTTQDKNTTTNISESYSLDAAGNPRAEVFDATWIALLLLFVYMVLAEWSSGRTLGKRAVGIKVVDPNQPDRTGIPLGKAALRQVAMYLGVAPVLIVQLFFLSSIDEASEMEALLHSGSYILTLIIVGVFATAWLLWIVIAVARKRDPVYDRLAGTAVVVK